MTPTTPLHAHGFTLMLSFGKWGGFYTFKGKTLRLCLGWIAFTFLPLDIDPLLDRALDHLQPAATAPPSASSNKP